MVMQVYGYPYACKVIVDEYSVTFLSEQAPQRQRKGKGGQDKVSWDTLEACTKALSALWREESIDPDNPIHLQRPSADMQADPLAQFLLNCEFGERDYCLGPITEVVRRHKENVKLKQEIGDLEGYTERAFRSHLCDLTRSEFFKAVEACWSPEFIAKKDVFTGLMTAAGFTIGASSLLRGHSQQNLAMCDLWPSLVGADETKSRRGYLQTSAVCQHGKILGVRQTQHAAFRRHKNPLRCPCAHLGFFLFWRFHGPDKEAPLDLTRRSEWYDRHVLPQQADRNKGVSDSLYAAAIKLAYMLSGLSESKIALVALRHIGRRAGSQFLQEDGIGRENIAAHGGWQQGKVYNFSYMFQCDESSLHSAAGFVWNPKEPYVLERADLADDVDMQHWIQFAFTNAPLWDPLLRKASEHPDIWKQAGADDTRAAAQGMNDLMV